MRANCNYLVLTNLTILYPTMSRVAFTIYGYNESEEKGTKRNSKVPLHYCYLFYLYIYTHSVVNVYSSYI